MIIACMVDMMTMPFGETMEMIGCLVSKMTTLFMVEMVMSDSRVQRDLILC